jgi:hypothetical protein
MTRRGTAWSALASNHATSSSGATFGHDEPATSHACREGWLSGPRATTDPRAPLQVRSRERERALGPADRGAYDRVARCC